jgi:hypothetical protein
MAPFIASKIPKIHHGYCCHYLEQKHKWHDIWGKRINGIDAAVIHTYLFHYPIIAFT